MPHLYLAPWEWAARGSMSMWQSPGGLAVGSLDLRTLPQMSIAGGTPEGVGLFAYDQPQDLGAALGSFKTVEDLASATLSDNDRRSIEKLLGLNSVTVSATSVRDLLRELLTTLSDAAGLAAPRGLMPTGRQLEIALGGFGVLHREPFSASAHPHVIMQAQEDYRAVRTETLEGTHADGFYLRVLQALSEKYALPTATFIPSDLPVEAALPHQTTVSDNFNRADNADMSVGASFNWTDVFGDFQITSNQAGLNTTGAARLNACRAEFDVSSADHVCSATITDLDAPGAGAQYHGGCCARFASAAETYYYATLYQAPPGSDFGAMGKMVAGVNTALGTDSAITWAATDTVACQASGSSISRAYNGTTQTTATDTGITTGTRGGLSGYNSGVSLSSKADDWSVADLAAAAATIRRARLMTMGVGAL